MRDRTEQREREEREAREAADRAAAQAKAEKEAAEAAARALLEQKEREAAEAAARAKKEQEEREERERAERAAKEAEEACKAKEAAEAATRNHRGASAAGLDEFDLGAFGNDTPMRESELSDFGSELGSEYSFMTNNRDSLRLSQVLDLESIDAFTSGARSSRGFDRLSTLSDASAPSDRRSAQPSVREEEDSEFLSDEEGEQELCGGCNQVLEGEAVGALSRYFHYEVRCLLVVFVFGCMGCVS